MLMCFWGGSPYDYRGTIKLCVFCSIRLDLKPKAPSISIPVTLAQLVRPNGPNPIQNSHRS